LALVSLDDAAKVKMILICVLPPDGGQGKYASLLRVAVAGSFLKRKLANINKPKDISVF
jgi:hypothetical protein